MYPCQKRFGRLPFPEILAQVYLQLDDYFGPQNWWPAETPFETIVGAILTQSVNWGNVEKAIDNLRREGLLNPAAMNRVADKKLAELIRPSGYYNMKARKLKAFLAFLDQEYDGSLTAMFSQLPAGLRKKLLGVYGIGPETADSILLYAGHYPIFVIDAYTRRLFHRLLKIPEDIAYHHLQERMMAALSPDAKRFNQYHALIVRLAKENCRKKRPYCQDCPLA